MPRYKDEPPAVRVYTVCDESKYLIVRNVPALGCGDELQKLFASYGNVEECKPMDYEDCEPFTDVFWIKFHQVNNARFAKRKLDEFVFYGNRLQVSYAPEYETLTDTKEKLEGRRREILARINPGRPKVLSASCKEPFSIGAPSHTEALCQPITFQQRYEVPQQNFHGHGPSAITTVSSNQDYFPSQSMNQTVRLVREKLNKVSESGVGALEGGPSKKNRVDNRRRI